MESSQRDLYAVLDLPPTATPQEIRTRFLERLQMVRISDVGVVLTGLPSILSYWY